jgi:arylformamidase
MKIYDISRTLSSSIAVWPGDQVFEQSWTMQIARGAAVNLSAIKMSVHAGTHADAPLHFLKDGPTIGELSLEKFVGPVTVIEIENSAKSIKLADVQALDFSKTQRLLFKTRASLLDDSIWVDDFIFLATETAEFLGKNSVQLIGMDTPSVDPMTSKTLDTHKMLACHGIVNLENLKLAGVPPGDYQLIALPLKLAGLDASPVRAILIGA